MWNFKVSTLQLSSVLGRNRFRSVRFWGGGAGGAAGALVLDCQGCPVYHLDGLIVLQSQLSSLENCVDLHSKKPQMRLSTSGAWKTKPDFCAMLSSIFPVCVCVSIIQPWPPRETTVAVGPVMTHSDPSGFLSWLKLKIWKLTFRLQPSTSTDPKYGTSFLWKSHRGLATLRGGLLCLSSRWRRLMKTKHFRVKAFAARVGLSDLRRARPDFILKYHRRGCQYVKASVREPAQHAFLPSSWESLRESQPDVNARNGESIWWENPLLSLNPLLVELPFTVVIAPQAPLQLRLFYGTLPEKAAN